MKSTSWYCENRGFLSDHLDSFCCNCIPRYIAAHQSTFVFESPLDRSPGSSKAARPLQTLTLQHKRAPRKVLPIYLNGFFKEEAFADSGSTVSCMSKTYADSIGAKITSTSGLNEIVFDLPIKGRELRSCGRAEICCEFPTFPYMLQKSTFYIFEEFLCDVIIGYQFLRHTETLDVHQHRLKVDRSAQNHGKAVKSIGVATEQVQCWLDGHSVQPLLDTSAATNLMSLSFARNLGHFLPNSELGYFAQTLSYFARRLGYGVRDDEENVQISFVDCSKVKSEGKIFARVSFLDGSPKQDSVHHLIDENTGNVTSGTLGPNSIISEPFYVVENLRYEVILGETFINTLDAYNKLRKNFISTVDVSAIAVHSLKHWGEGKKGVNLPANGPNHQFDPKNRIRRMYDKEVDRYDKELEEIEIRSSSSTVSEDEIQQQRHQAQERHLNWWRENLSQMEQHFPDQEIPAGV